MAKSSSGMKPAHLSAEFIKRTAGLIGGAAEDYIKEAMPISSNIVSDAKSSVTSVANSLKTNAQNVFGKVRNMKSQQPMRSIFSWYMGKEAEFGESNGFDSAFSEIDENLSFDTDTSDSNSLSQQAEIAKVQIGETEAASNKVSQAIIESAAKSLEGNMQLTGNILTAIDAQNSLIKSGFETTHEILNKILEVVTKNTATMIQVQQASSKYSDSDRMILNGKFDLNSYIKNVTKNAKSSGAGMIASMASAFLNPSMAKMLLTPENLTSMAFNSFIDKKNPNLKKNLKAIDDALNETIMNSLIRLGENDGSFGKRLGKILGIKSDRNEFRGNMSQFELKSVPFDTVTKEAITQSIPGYLRKILVQLGGEDVQYDYQSRSFKSRGQIRQEFMRNATSRNVMHRTSSQIRNAFGNDEWGNMMYDMMFADLSNKTNGYGSMSGARSTVSSFAKKGGFTQYAKDLYSRNGVNVTNDEIKRLEAISKNLVAAMQTGAGNDIIMNIQRENIRRNSRMSEYLQNAENYGNDLRDLKTSVTDEIRQILTDSGRVKSDNRQVSSSMNNALFGTDYTNRALFEIYRLLDRGINVFQVGSSDTQKNAYKMRNDKFLPKPRGLMIKVTSDAEHAAASPNPTNIFGENSEFGNQPNELLGEGTAGDRLKNWTKGSYGNLKNAIFNANPDQVRAAFGKMFADVSDVGKDKLKHGFEKVNASFGNVTGYLKHKFTGGEYSYTDENGKEHHVKANEKGGIFGFIGDSFKESISGAKKTGTRWFNQVKNYFNFSGDKDEKSDVKSKRSKLISTSVGALMGSGLLGGPIGLIMGGLAGSAIGSIDGFGDKIKAMFFGRDPQTGKPTGLLTKLGDGIVNPIKFQIAKSANRFGNLIKKNLLGPISNIGAAIKERIENAADSHFGKAFKFIGNVLTAPFKLVTGLAKLPFKLMSSLTRGVFTGASNVVGFGLNSLAKGIAGSKGRDVIKDRIAEQKEDYNKEMKYELDENGEIVYDENGKPKRNLYQKFFGGYRQWVKEENKRKLERSQKFNEYTKETEYTEEEWKKKEMELMEDQTNDIHKLTEHAVEGNSLYVHDSIMHQQLDTLIQLMGGTTTFSDGHDNSSVAKNSNVSSKDSVLGEAYKKQQKDAASDEGTAETIALGSIIAASANGDIDNTDKSEVMSITDEAAKKNSDPAKQKRGLAKILDRAKEKAASIKEAKESILERIKDIVKGGGILAAVLAAIKLLTEIFTWLKENLDIKGILRNIKNSVGLLISGDDDPNTDATDEGVNDVAALTDSHFSNKWSLANPMALVYHNQKDGAGSYIKDQGKTRAKSNLQLNYQFGDYTRKSKAAKAAATPAAAPAKPAAATIKTDPDVLNTSDLMSELDDVPSTTAATIDVTPDTPTAARQNTNSILSNFEKVGLMSLGSNLAGWVFKKGATALGADEEMAQKIGDVSSRAATAGLMINEAKAVTKSLATGTKHNSALDFVLQGLRNLLAKLAEKCKAAKALKKFTEKIDNLVDNIFGKTRAKLTDKLAEKIASKIALATGKATTEELISAVALGIPIVVGGIVGLVSGFCGTEYLFGIAPGMADGTMKTISTILTGVFSALEMVPGVGLFIAALDVIDEFIIKTIFGKTLKSYLATVMYGWLAGDEKEALLEQRQKEFDDERKYYEEEYGATIDSNAWNDLVNNSGLFDTIWRGGIDTDENGHFVFDEAGGRIGGGLSYLFKGGETLYSHDENGNIIRNAQGEAVKAVDAYGNTLHRDGDDGLTHVGNSIKRFFVGGDVYKTDENGQALVDENGNYIVESTESNLFGKIGDSIAKDFNNFKTGLNYAWKGIESFSDYMAGGVEDLGTLASDAGSAIWDGIKSVGSAIGDGAESVVSYLAGGVEDLGTLIGDAGSAAWDSIKSVGNYMAGGIEDLGTLIGDAGAAAWDGIKSVGSTIWDGAKSVADYMAGGVEDLGTLLGDAGSAIWDGIKSVGSTILDGAKSVGNYMAEGVEDLGTLIGDFWDWAFGGPNPMTAPNVPFQNNITNNYYGVGGPDDNPLESTAMITSPFGKRVFPKKDDHKGIDLVPADGSKESKISSTATGTISYVKNNVPDTDTARKNAMGNYVYNGSNSGGNQVWIDTDDGRRIKSMHLKAGSIPKELKPGSRVFAGTQIGSMGSTGWSTGPHLHYQVEDRYGKAIDPRYTGLRYKSIGGMGAPDSDGLVVSVRGLTNKIQTLADEPVYESNESGFVKGVGTSNDIFTAQITGTEESSGILGDLLNQLGSMGSEYLNIITGGLYGEYVKDDDKLSSLLKSSITDYRYDPTTNISEMSNLDLFKAVFLTPFTYEGQGTAVKRFLAMCENEMGTVEDYSKADKVKYNKWFYGDETTGAWCCVFVHWCFAAAGIALTTRTAACETLRKESIKKSTYIPFDTAKPIPGDIAFFDFDHKGESHHVGIVEQVFDDGKRILCVEGNVTGFNNEFNKSSDIVKTGADGKKRGAVAKVYREQSYTDGKPVIMGYSRAVNFDNLDSLIEYLVNTYNSAAEITSLDGGNLDLSSLPTNPFENNESLKTMYHYLTSPEGGGYNNIAAAGMLGSMKGESWVDGFRAVEGYHDGIPSMDEEFKSLYNGDLDLVGSDRERMNQWRNRIFDMHRWDYYTHAGYNGKDGNKYVGLGLAQLTGERGENLLNFAKEKGLKWYDPATQVQFIENEVNQSSSLRAELNNAATPEDAAEIWTYKYEKCHDDSIDRRKGYARKIYELRDPETGGSENDPYVPFIGEGIINDTPMIGESGDVLDLRESFAKNYLRKTSARSREILNKLRRAGGPGYTYNSHVSPSNSGIMDNSISISSSILDGTSKSRATTNGVDLSGVLNAIALVVQQLGEINANTSTSNSYLDAINKKDFVDKGLRDTFSSLKSVSPKNNKSTSIAPSASARAVTALVRG